MYECDVPSECDVRGGRYCMSVMYPVSVMSGEGTNLSGSLSRETWIGLCNMCITNES